MVKSFFKIIGLDKTIALTISARLIQAFGGIGSIFFIARFLSKAEQGYYYTFLSFIAIQVFLELGLTSIITQYTAHEFAHLEYKNFQVHGKEYHKSRLASLLKFCVKWFGCASVILFFILLAFGFYFFSSFNQNSNVEWENPWVILCLTTSLNLFIDPILAFIEGLGDVKDIAKLRLVQRATNVIFLFLFLLLGFKLYSAALASVLSILINYLQIYWSPRIYKLKIIWSIEIKCKVQYYREIFPLQWKIALSWLSGYLIFQLFNPVLFAYEGAEAAGKMGITLQILGGISTLTMSWITTKIPLLSSLISEKKIDVLNSLFKKTFNQLVVINAIMVISLFLTYMLMRSFNFNFIYRFLDPIPFVLLCSVTIVNQLVFTWATYLRCHKQEPFLINSIVVGLLCGLSTIILGKYCGVLGIVWGYSIICIFISLPWSYYIYKTKRNLWYS